MSRNVWIVIGVLVVVGVITAFLCAPKRPVRVEPGAGDRGDNGLWASRRWVHGPHGTDERVALAADLEARGITRLYPFLGPPNPDGVPGYRSQGQYVPYEPDTARDFFEEMETIAPQIKVIVWTGGVLKRDINFASTQRNAEFIAHLVSLCEMGADGVQINVEPLASDTEGYIELLSDIKEAIGPDKVLSIAAYPPETMLHPFPDVHWSLEFTKEVCMVADEMAFMGYDTALKNGERYQGLMELWTTDLMKTLPPPSEGGCDWWMGVPAYEDEGVGYHDPETETIENGIRGVLRAVASGTNDNFRGIAVYADWTADDQEWETYDALWRAP